MSQDATYHRRFLPDGPFESHCRGNCHNPDPKRKLDENPEFVKPLKRGPYDDYFNPPRQPDPPKPKPYYASQKRRPAFMMINNGLRAIHIVDKIDQGFASVATPWEHEYSALVKEGPGRFVPVVDETYEVIGHVAEIAGSGLLVVADESLRVQKNHHGRIEEFLDEDEAMYVSRKTGDGWTQFDTLQPASLYTVVTGVDGEVITGSLTGYAPGAISTKGPLELLTDNIVVDIISFAAGGVVFKIAGAIVRGIVRSIARRVAQNIVVRTLAGATRNVVTRVLARRAARRAASKSYNPITGMTTRHHRSFIDAAQETQHIIVVRHTNPKSIGLIERGCPGKPKNLEFINTSPNTGIVMANTADDVIKAKKLGYYVVGEGNVASRTVMKGGKEVVEEMPVKSAFWQVEKGQVIDPVLKKPIVGDYDLMGVIDPTKPADIIGIVARGGKTVTDVVNPTVLRAAEAINRRMDMPRVLHGAQDMYKGFRKGATAYMPNGTVKHFATEAEVKAFYTSLGRQPRAGMHPRPNPNTPVKDELAGRRRR